jgi:HEXXH motif-containing protein
MIEYHRVPADRFADLASGLGGPAAVTDLAEARLSKNLLLLRYAAEAWPGEEGQQAAEVLIAADRREPQVTAEVLGDPLVGAWLADTARRLRGIEESEIPIQENLAQLGALAAAAAYRAGIDARIRTRTRGGVVTLPTVGTAHLGYAHLGYAHLGSAHLGTAHLGTTRLDSDGDAVVTVSGGRVTVATAAESVEAGDDPRWQPVRLLAASAGDATAAVVLEDANPFRDLYHARPADRLAPGEAARWQILFTDAWQLLADHLPERAAELAAGLRSVVPLVTDNSGEARSGTARDAFGAVGLTRPRSGADFAVTLVHEFQHSKLSALLDLATLHTPGGDERHFAPWRTDPRPTGGLIQGVYAFFGVADAWRALRVVPGLEADAAREFAFARLQVSVGLDALEQSNELTDRGREFVGGLRRSVSRLLADSVPDADAAAAEKTLADRHRAWSQHVRVL